MINADETNSSKSTLSLDSLKRGKKGRVSSVGTKNRALCQKLLSMGIVAGTIVEVLSIAPLGDPIKVSAMGYKLSLRISEAQNVEVIPV